MNHQHQLNPNAWLGRRGWSRANTVNMTYVFDAYCPWSYAVSPIIQTFAAQRDRVALEVTHGSFYPPDRMMPIDRIEWLPSAITSIAGLTGAVFGDGYRRLAERGTFVMDSGQAAIGFVALRSIAPDLALPLAMAMQRAFFHDGLSLSDAGTYAAIAGAHDLDQARLTERLADRTVRRIVGFEAARSAGLGIDTYPALLLHAHDGTIPIATRLRSAEQLGAALLAHERLADRRLVAHPA